MSAPFQGKVAFVTGAASGIGRATALALAQRGARVLAADLSDAGEATAVALRELGGDARFHRCDVTRAAEVQAAVAAAESEWGGLDLAVNAAGVPGLRAPTADYPDDEWQKVLTVNLTGTWLCLKHEIAAMLRRGGGSVVNVASMLGLVGLPKTAAYCASKHGIVGLTRAAALEYAAKGIRINALCPGFTDTPLLDAADADRAKLEQKMLAGLQPMRRLARPEEIAEVAVWLCSEGASFVTGQALAADGGYVAQ